MNGLPYYKAYPRDFIEGTIGMPFELKAAYRLILDLIYMQGGNLPDDERYISGLLGCTIRKWKSLRYDLIACGKIKVSGEFLTNERAISELETLRKLSEKQSENRSRPNKNRELQSPPFDHTEPDTDNTLSSVYSAPPQSDFDALQSKLVDAAGGKIQPHAALVVGPIVELTAAGVDLEVDILPVIRSRAAKMARPVGSWAYFIPAIREAYERRVAAGRALPPPPKIGQSDDDWARRLRFARKRSGWSHDEWGPAPGEDGCLVPTHLLQPGDGGGWQELKAEPKRSLVA